MLGEWAPSSQALGYGAFGMSDGAHAIERAAQELRTVLADNLAMDRHEVALAKRCHGEVTSQDDAAAMRVFLRQGCITEKPKTPVGMHERELSRKPAIVRRMGHAKITPTGLLKRAFRLLEI